MAETLRSPEGPLSREDIVVPEMSYSQQELDPISDVQEFFHRIYALNGIDVPGRDASSWHRQLTVRQEDDKPEVLIRSSWKPVPGSHERIAMEAARHRQVPGLQIGSLTHELATPCFACGHPDSLLTYGLDQYVPYANYDSGIHASAYFRDMNLELSDSELYDDIEEMGADLTDENFFEKYNLEFKQNVKSLYAQQSVKAAIKECVELLS